MVALFFASCGDDPIIEIPLGPEISFVSDPGFLDTDSELIIGETFSVKVRLSKGDAQLNTLAIDEGNSKLPTSQFTINSGAITSNNPLLITGTDKDGTTYAIDITPSAGLVVGDITTYTFTVTDESGETDTRDIVITTAEVPGTDISMDISGVLLNQAGPAGTGGVDLATGVGTGSANAAAELRDLGLDCTMNPGTFNWKRQIGTVNDAVMVRVDPTQLENFDYDNVTKVESIIAAYDTGLTLDSGTSTNCANGATTTVPNTADVAEGNVFAVLSEGIYYLVRIDAVNENNTGNDDNYELSIKF